MALIEKVADRMLSLVAPKLTAGASCCLSNGKHVTQYCYGGYCTDHYIYQQNCVINCFCEIVNCGACYKVVACG
jgi:hypothetical protein